ncbi:head-tail connector protein [Bacillus mycoides]|uniref:head-tail connector protein n=1 Tax=Bacillus mycoides TaxID=1405 RepID=UPI003D656A64
MNDSQLLEDVKSFLRVTWNEDDIYISSLIESAKEYMYGATGKEYEGNDNIEILCLKFLVNQWYHGQVERVPNGVQSMLTHIEYKK